MSARNDGAVGHWLGTIGGLFALREAVTSVAVSHGEGCGCVTCRAAAGDEDAWHEVLIAALEERGS